MRKKRIMIMGPSRCGKTSLANHINKYDGPLKRTQDLIYGEKTMDVPGAYIENPWMYKHLIAGSQDASCILLLVDQSNCTEVYSPGFARVFRSPVIGVITKSDLNPENETTCRKQLKAIGVKEPYFSISMMDGRGLKDLEEYIFEVTAGNQQLDGQR